MCGIRIMSDEPLLMFTPDDSRVNGTMYCTGKKTPGGSRDNTGAHRHTDHTDR